MFGYSCRIALSIALVLLFSTSSFAQKQIELNIQVDSGYVFVDQQYLSPPYIIRTEDTKLLVNDIAVAEVDATDAINSAMDLRRHLQEGAVLIATQGGPIDALPLFDKGQQFLCRLVEKQPQEFSISRTSFVTKDWERNFNPPPELVGRARYTLAAINEAESIREGMRQRRTWTLALTILGIVVAVAAGGHLLVSWPALQSFETPSAPKTVVWSALFITGVIVLDILWTALTQRIGLVNEVNIFAESVASEPTHLWVLKMVATFVGVGMLLAYRQHKSVQYGAWCICLFSVMLTCRWLTLNWLFLA